MIKQHNPMCGETAVQTVRSSKATAAEPRASSPYQSVSLVNSA